MKKLLKNNSLSIVLFLMFGAMLVGQYVTGWYEYNQDQRDHGAAPVTLTQYAGEGHFLEAVFENWESEFLQMGVFVLFTVFLFQKGSAESKDPDKEERVDKIMPSSAKNPEMPWPVRRGGIALTLYSYSLTIALFSLFAISFVFHGVGGLGHYNQENLEHGRPAETLGEYMSSTTFWFESFQNWQSEFLSIAMMVVLSVFLRQRGSPESKPVDTPHSDTGH